MTTTLPPAPPALISLEKGRFICRIVPALCQPPKHPPAPPQHQPADVPGPLPIFGAAAAFGWGRTLRQRIREAGK